MRKGAGIVGATLIFDQRDGMPDLVLAMQYLVDDLRSEGRAIGAIKLTASTLRLRADPFEMILTIAASPLPAQSMQGLLRPPMGDKPDFARVHLARTLRLHTRAMGFILRRRGAPVPDLADALSELAREGKFLLLPLIEAAPPSLLVWQPGSLVLSTEEFRRATIATLLRPGDPNAPLAVTPPDRLALARPGAAAVPPVPVAMQSDPPTTLRAERYENRSLGRIFGSTRDRPTVLPRLERETERLFIALRDTEGNGPARPAGQSRWLPFREKRRR